MGRPLQLESFDSPGAEMLSVLFPETQLEEARLEAFDNGYKAGWDDSAEAHAKEQGRISVELANNLQELSFTYHEARTAMLAEMEGILRGMIDTVLPTSLHHSLGELILQQVSEIAADSADVMIEIVVAPENVGQIRKMTESAMGPPLTVLEESSLGPGQAYLRMGRVERKLDMDSVLNDISGAVASFFENPTAEEIANA